MSRSRIPRPLRLITAAFLLGVTDVCEASRKIKLKVKPPQSDNERQQERKGKHLGKKVNTAKKNASTYQILKYHKSNKKTRVDSKAKRKAKRKVNGKSNRNPNMIIQSRHHFFESRAAQQLVGGLLKSVYAVRIGSDIEEVIVNAKGQIVEEFNDDEVEQFELENQSNDSNDSYVLQNVRDARNRQLRDIAHRQLRLGVELLTSKSGATPGVQTGQVTESLDVNRSDGRNGPQQRTSTSATTTAILAFDIDAKGDANFILYDNEGKVCLELQVEDRRGKVAEISEGDVIRGRISNLKKFGDHGKFVKLKQEGSRRFRYTAHTVEIRWNDTCKLSGEMKFAALYEIFPLVETFKLDDQVGFNYYERSNPGRYFSKPSAFRLISSSDADDSDESMATPVFKDFQEESVDSVNDSVHNSVHDPYANEIDDLNFSNPNVRKELTHVSELRYIEGVTGFYRSAGFQPFATLPISSESSEDSSKVNAKIHVMLGRLDAAAAYVRGHCRYRYHEADVSDTDALQSESEEDEVDGKLRGEVDRVTYEEPRISDNATITGVYREHNPFIVTDKSQDSNETKHSKKERRAWADVVCERLAEGQVRQKNRSKGLPKNNSTQQRHIKEFHDLCLTSQISAGQDQTSSKSAYTQKIPINLEWRNEEASQTMVHQGSLAAVGCIDGFQAFEEHHGAESEDGTSESSDDDFEYYYYSKTNSEDNLEYESSRSSDASSKKSALNLRKNPEAPNEAGNHGPEVERIKLNAKSQYYSQLKKAKTLFHPTHGWRSFSASVRSIFEESKGSATTDQPTSRDLKLEASQARHVFHFLVGLVQGRGWQQVERDFRTLLHNMVYQPGQHPDQDDNISLLSSAKASTAAEGGSVRGLR